MSESCLVFQQIEKKRLPPYSMSVSELSKEGGISTATLYHHSKLDYVTPSERQNGKDEEILKREQRYCLPQNC
ncbi:MULTISPECIES: hypothetical protein [Vibrio]|uniref:hypothetical protein n=1 Tax=Vibrio TaxID=662 RepID=UPI0019D027D8|nr:MULTISPECIES: hypothetical protein [Vibrio]MBN3574507.1 hypothetical protein [Vibrio neptunius]NRB70152.1 hypothetical protein [Vibrio sp.]QXX05838.1 hypothetical protein KW548_11720 [Vibrio neptunius]